jgi:hypothetical protein
VKAFPRATHFYMLSGDCMPIKSAEYAHALPRREDVDYIESFDFFESDWIKTGIKEERLIYRHWFNERTQKALFYCLDGLQRKLGLARKVPADLQIMIGSQWWCLRRRTVEAVLDSATAARRDAVLPHHLDPGRDVLSDPGPPSGARGARSAPHADLPDVHRLRDAGDLLQRPLRPAAGAGLPVRPQDQPRGQGAEGRGWASFMPRPGGRFAISDEGRGCSPS